MAFSTERIKNYTVPHTTDFAEFNDVTWIYQTPFGSDVHKTKWNELKRRANIGPVPDNQTKWVYTPKDHEKYMEYKRKMMLHLKGESFKSTIREMWSYFYVTNQTAERIELEKLYPWLLEELETTVASIKWAFDALGNHMINGFKPTRDWIEFCYAIKTDEGLNTIVRPLINNVISANRFPSDSIKMLQHRDSTITTNVRNMEGVLSGQKTFLNQNLDIPTDNWEILDIVDNPEME